MLFSIRWRDRPRVVRYFINVDSMLALNTCEYVARIVGSRKIVAIRKTAQENALVGVDVVVEDGRYPRRSWHAKQGSR
jgi:hypothetical protein